MRGTTWRQGIGVAALAGLIGGPAAAGPAPRDGDDKAEAEIKLGVDDLAFMDSVNAAIRRGVEGLLAKGTAEGRWPTEHDAGFPHGGTALAILALVKSGQNPALPKLEAGIAWLHERWDTWKAGGMPEGAAGAWKTYEAGITLMMLEAIDRWRPDKQPKADHTAVVAEKLKPRQREWVKELRDFLLANQAFTRQVAAGGGKAGGAPRLDDRKEAWSYPFAQRGITDHSNTQYAILGLRSAGRLGHPSPADVWIRIAEHFLFTQATDGEPVKRVRFDRDKAKAGYVRVVTEARLVDHARGWGYGGGDKPQAGTGQLAQTGSMTTVGIACLALAFAELDGAAGKGDALAREAVRRLDRERAHAIDDGFAWLAHRWTVSDNPNYGTWHYYYLYGLERAGILTKRPNVGANDWYREGARLLVDQQHGNLWDDRNGDGVVCSTAFALLFLLRATVPLTKSTGYLRDAFEGA